MFQEDSRSLVAGHSSLQKWPILCGVCFSLNKSTYVKKKKKFGFFFSLEKFGFEQVNFEMVLG